MKIFSRYLKQACFIILICAACQRRSDNQALVVVSIAAQTEFVQALCGDFCQVKPVVPAAASPHFYEPTPSQMMECANALAWFRIGEPFEHAISHFLQTQAHSAIKIVDTRKDVPLIRGSACSHDEHGDCDTHIWLSPKMAQIQVRTIAATLMELFPDKKEVLQARLLEYLQKLQFLDETITQWMKPLQGKTIVVSHPAFAYFCRDYGLVQQSIEEEGRDPSPQHITHLIQNIQHEHLHTIFLLSQYYSKGAELLAQKLHLKLRVLDPYRADYLDNMRIMAQEIAKDG